MNIRNNVLVTVADKNLFDQSKQLFYSAYFNGGWRGDMMILSPNLNNSQIRWFTKNGIIVKIVDTIYSESNFGGYSPSLSLKFYPLSMFFKKWKTRLSLQVMLRCRQRLNSLKEKISARSSWGIASPAKRAKWPRLMPRWCAKFVPTSSRGTLL